MIAKGNNEVKNYKTNSFLDGLRLIFLLMMSYWALELFIVTTGIKLTHLEWNTAFFFLTVACFQLVVVVPFAYWASKEIGMSFRKAYWHFSVQNKRLQLSIIFISLVLVITVNMYSSW